MTHSLKIHEDAIRSNLSNFVKYAEGLAEENEYLKGKLLDVQHKEEEKNESLSSYKLAEVLDIFLGMSDILTPQSFMSEYKGYIAGLKEYILTHKSEINSFIDNNPEFFKGD